MDGSSQPLRGVSIEEYVSGLIQEGTRVVSGPAESYWLTTEMRCLERMPWWRLDEAPARDVDALLWRARSPAAAYGRHPDASHPQNAVLYVCQDQNYAMDNLEHTARKNLKRALGELRFEFIEPHVLLEKGVVPYCDTRTRIGLSDGTPELFRKRFERTTANPARKIVGAWRGDVLAAFLSIIVVEDCVTTAAVGAATEYLSLRPNDGLIHFVLDYYLKRHHFRLVTAGPSSVQEDAKRDTMDRFKRKMGFEAWPIHRGFMLHPLLKPLANRVTLSALRACTRYWTSNRALRKATGLLATYLAGKEPA